MKIRKLKIGVMVAALCAAVTACGNSKEAETTAAEVVTEAATEAAETTAAVDVAVFQISGGAWYLNGEVDAEFIDMDGLRGFTSYTKEAIPEYEGYLVHLGENEDGDEAFDVYDLYGRQFMTITFTSDTEFYVDEDTEKVYVKLQ